MKIKSIVVGAVVASSMVAPAFATPNRQFSDVSPTNWAYQAIVNLNAIMVALPVILMVL